MLLCTILRWKKCITLAILSQNMKAVAFLSQWRLIAIKTSCRTGTRGAWVSRGRQQWSPANGGLGWATDGTDLRDSRRSPPNSNAEFSGLWWGYRAATSCHGETDRQEQDKRLSKNEKNKKCGEKGGAAYCLGLVFCPGAQNRDEQGTQRWEVNSKWQCLMNPNKADKAGQTHRGTPGSNK